MEEVKQNVTKRELKRRKKQKYRRNKALKEKQRFDDLQLARLIIEELQWGGVGGREGEVILFCPICKGVNPNHYDEEIRFAEEGNTNHSNRIFTFYPSFPERNSHRGHKPSCPINDIFK